MYTDPAFLQAIAKRRASCLECHGPLGFQNPCLYPDKIRTLYSSQRAIGNAGDVAWKLLLRLRKLDYLNIREEPFVSPIQFPVLLAQNANLTVVCLFDVAMSPVAMVATGKWLRNSLSITILRLERCFLNDDDVKIITEALKYNTSLRTLDVSRNGITIDGFLALIEMMHINVSITALTFDWNIFGKKCLPLIEDTMRSNFRWYHTGPDFTSSDVSQLCNKNFGILCRCLYAVQDALIAFLGMRKRHRFQCGMFQDCPREILKIIACYTWNMRTWRRWEEE